MNPYLRRTHQLQILFTLMPEILRKMPRRRMSSGQRRAGSSEATHQHLHLRLTTCIIFCRFEYCDLTIPTTDNSDETLNYKHYFNNEIRMLANASIPKRSVAIAKEVCDDLLCLLYTMNNEVILSWRFSLRIYRWLGIHQSSSKWTIRGSTLSNV